MFSTFKCVMLLKSVQSALSDLLTTSATHGTFSRPSAKRGLISMIKLLQFTIITHLAGQTYVWHGCKWNFAGPQIYLQPAKIKSQHFGVSLKFLVCN